MNKHLISFLCALIVSIGQLFAVPAYRGWQTKTQPDGTTITVRLIGDEFYHHWETEDGRIATMLDNGTFVISDEQAPSNSEVVARRKAAALRKGVGEIRKNYGAIQPTKLLVILVNFSDKSMKSAHDNAFFANLLNGSFPSVQDYFKQSSGSTYVPQFDVFGPYTLDRNMAYYGGNDSDGNDEHPDQMVVDACAKAYADGCNFSNYDTNNDGKVDNIYVIYAGYGEAAGAPANTIWPHSWEIYSQYVSGTLKYNNKTLGHYACSAELSGKSGSNSDGVGTFAHEFSHVIGLPDYYDTDYGTNSDNGVTPGEWTLMDQGSYNGSGMYPPLYSVYDKYFMGWMTPKFLAKDEVKNVTLTTAWNDNYQITGGASRVACTNTSTVYYLENRQKSGYDQYLPGHGMVVWKVTYNATRWNNNDLNNTAGTLRYTIVPADGKTKNYGAATDPFPGTGNKRMYTPATGCALTEITESSGNINFKYNGGVIKTTWDYVLYGENCTYPADGEITKDATLNLTITPNTGYSLADAACWDVTMGGTKLTYGTDFTYNAGTNKFTITSVTGDVEILISAGHPVNWYAQGTKVATNVAAEGKITLPAAPSNCSASRQFVGWCTNSTYKSADTPPTYAKTGDAYSVANYYAVYADVSGGGSANATYTFSDKSWSASPSNWTSGKDGAGYINSGVQVTAKTTGANATCPTSYSNISSIVVSYCTNASSGAGSIKMTVDGTDISESVTSSGGTTPRDLEFDFSENTPTGTPQITVNCSTNSIYICGVTITYGSASYSGFSTDCTAPDPCALTSITLNTADVKTAFTTGEAFTSEGLVVTANYSNCSSKTVTPTSVSTPDMSSTGNKTVTVTYTENTETKSTTYNITVSAPTTYAIRFFDGATQLKEESLIMGATATPPSVDDCDEYEFIGWYTSTLPTTNTTSHTWVSDFTVSGAQDYYAVFSHTEGSSGGGTSEVASVTFVTVSSDSNTDNSGTDAKIKNNLVDEYSGISSFSGSKLYAGTAGVKLGTGSATGSITLTLTAAANIKTVKVSAKKYGSDTGSLSVTAGSTSVGSAQAPPSSIGELTFTATSAIEDATTITVATSSKRAYISSIVVIAEGGGSSTTYYTTTKDCTIPTEVTVKFDANGGEGTMTDQTIDYNTATALKANSFERTGYTFLGWATTTDGAKVYDDEEEVTLTKKVTTLYAVWEKNSWKVYFTTPSGATSVTANGETTSPLTVEYGETVTIIITPDAEHIIGSVTATGGAVLSGEGGTRTFTMPDNDVALSISMTMKPSYTIRFFNMGETISSQSVIEGQTATQPESPSACEGYTFAGWWNDELGTDNTTAETWITTFTATQDQDYYAVYSHTEDSGGGSESPVTKTMDTFDAISGNVDGDENISYEAAKGEASTAPAVNSDEIRIYQNGGTLTVTANNSKKITAITIGSSMETSVTYSIDGGTTSSSQSISANGTITLSDKNASTILFTCMGTDKNHRLYLNYLSVTYTGGGSGGGSTTYYTTAPNCTPCENKVILTKGEETHGTFTLGKANGTYNNCTSNFVVTVSDINPEANYYCTGVTATGGNNEVTGPDILGNYTVTYTKENSVTSTITANFAPIPTYTVTWSMNGDESNQSTYYVGDAIEFPTTATGCDDKVFIGWSASEVEETDIKPALVTSASMPNHDVTYYAVFAESSSGGTPTAILEETFDNDLSNDATSEFDDNTFTNFPTENSKAYKGAGGTIKLGASGSAGHITSKELDLSSAFTVSLDAKYYNTGSDNANIVITIDKGGANEQTATIDYSELTSSFKNFSFNFSEATSKSKVTIGTSIKRAYIDNVVITTGGGTSYSEYTTSCAACENKVTLTKGPETNGTFTLNKDDGEYNNCTSNFVVTVSGITPASGYHCTGVTATGENVDVSGPDGSGNYTVTYTKGNSITSTITANFALNPTYAVTWSMDGDESTVVYYEAGATIEFPTAATGCDGKTFTGWTATALDAPQDNAPTYVTSATMGTSAITYYAVYADVDGGGGGTPVELINEEFDNSSTVDASSAISTSTFANFSGDTDKAYKSQYGGIKLGSSGGSGYITTKPLDLSASFTVTMDVAKFGTDGGNIVVTILDADDNELDSKSILNANFGTGKSLSFDAATSISKVEIATSSKRAYIDNVVISRGSSTTYSNYVTSCGAGISAKNVGWITAAKGQKVKRVINVYAKGFDEATTLTATSGNAQFKVTLGGSDVPAGNTGLSTTLTVEYTPAAFSDRIENVEITLSAGGMTKTITVSGRSVPEEFLLITKKNTTWYALPANMTGSPGEYDGVTVVPNNPDGTPTAVAVSPSTIIYSLTSNVASRYADAGNCVHLVGNDNQCLWSNMAGTTGKTNIQNKTGVSGNAVLNNEWLLSTNDGYQYTIANPNHPHYPSRRLAYGAKFGMYEEETLFYIVEAGCTSQPGDVNVSARRAEATFSWESNASSVEIAIYSDENHLKLVKTETATSQPYIMKGLSEETNYWFKLTPVGEEACAVIGSFKTTGPTIDISEWKDGAVVVQIDHGEIVPSIVIDGQEEHGSITGGGGTATELFFAKYFEGYGTMKLVSIFNGTPNNISLANYKFYDRHAGDGASSYSGDSEYDLSSLGTIRAGQEIIFFSRPLASETAVKECSDAFLDSKIATSSSADANPRWVECASDKFAGKIISVNGNDALLLEKNGTIIDVIGALNAPGTQSNCRSEKSWQGTIKNMDKGKQPSDDVFDPYYAASSHNPVTTQDSIDILNGFGINLKDDEINIYTARCIFFRDNRVSSGDSAVAMNTDDFVTFTTHTEGGQTYKAEWYGRSVCMNNSDKTAAGVTDDGQATCNSYQDIANMDYNDYYIDYSSNVIPEQTLNPSWKDEETNLYTIPIPEMSKYTCLNLRFQLKKDGNVVTEAAQQVPIIIKESVDTNDPLFSELVKEDGTPLYQYSKERCSTCDVVVLGVGILTKGLDTDPKDVPEVGNIKIYPGGKLVIPENTEYTVNSLSFRRQEDELSTANIQGDLNIKESGNNVFFDLRVDPSNWHYIALPYDCNVADIRFVNDDEKIPVLGTDFLLKYYDGEKRAATQAGGCWEMVAADATLKKGIGYIFGIPGKGKVQREFRFPMSNEVVTEEKANKLVDSVYAYGGDKNMDEVRANHRGWNLLGNPYLLPYTSKFDGATYDANPVMTGYIVPDYPSDPAEQWDGHYKFADDDRSNLRYIVEPVDNGRSEYVQVAIKDYEMKPFTSYFVQIGGSDPTAKQGVQFKLDNVKRSSPVRRSPASYDVEDNHPVWVMINMTNEKGEKDETTMLISNDFTNGYDMMDDLVKMRGTYYQYAQITTKPVLASRNDEGEMAFNALPDSTARLGIPLNYFAAAAGQYKIALDGRYSLEEVTSVQLYDSQLQTWHNLLTEDYSFAVAKKEDNTTRFKLYVTVERKQPQTPTEMDNVYGKLTLTASDKTLLLSGLNNDADIYVYDISGKLIDSGHHIADGDNGVWRTSVPTQGVYFVRVNIGTEQQTLNTIVY